MTVTSKSTIPPMFIQKVTRYYAALAREQSPDDPIGRQFIPSPAEERRAPGELDDPLGEAGASPAPRLVQRYPDRALLLVTDRCAVHCRHCFRRHFTGRGGRVIGAAELAAALDYLRGRPAVRELLLSGGDPLTLPDGRFFGLLAAIRRARPDLALRVASRLPVVLPARFTPRLIAGLAAYRPLRLATQFNHPRELTGRSAGLLDALAAAGVPVLNQTVLLRGVNDQAGLLEELFRGLAARSARPYYLFQADLAAGTAHLRVNLMRGLAIAAELRRRLPAEIMPGYAVDLPGGGGKLDLLAAEPLRREDDRWIYRGMDGREYAYPIEAEEAQ